MTVEPLYLYFLLPDDEYLEVTTAVPLSRFPSSTIAVPRRPSASWSFDREAGEWVDETDPSELLAQERAGMVLSRAQFATAAFLAGHITEAEATAYAGAGTLPAFAEAAIAGLPEAQRAPARILAAGASEIRRANQLVSLMQAALELDDEAVDAMFRAGVAF